MTETPEPVLRWAVQTIGSGAQLVAVEQLRTHSGPWRLRAEHDGGTAEVVLKCGRAVDWRREYACEAAALRLAASHDLPVPGLLGSQLDASGDDPVALLMERLPGETKIPTGGDPQRQRALGRAAAQIHAIPLQPTADLPLRVRHTAWTDFADTRRWGNAYRNSPDGESVLERFVADHPGWTIEAARDELDGPHAQSTPLLDAADERLRTARAPEEPTVFVHGDLWQGNTLWDDDRCTGIIDWETAGAGQPGVDLGCLRWDAEMLFGADSADDVLAGWDEASGRTADSVAYWDVVAVLNYPTDMRYIVSSLTEQGRPDLDAATLNSRRDAFLEAALDALQPGRT